MWLETKRIARADRQYLAIIGRAVYLCQRFESNMEFVTGCEEAIAAHNAGTKGIFSIANEKNEKYQPRNRIERIHKLALERSGPPDEMEKLRTILENGCIGRNFIIHESCGLSRLSKKSSTQEEIDDDEHRGFYEDAASAVSQDRHAEQPIDLDDEIESYRLQAAYARALPLIRQRLKLLKRHLRSVIEADDYMSRISFYKQTDEGHCFPPSSFDYQKRILRWVLTSRI